MFFHWSSGQFLGLDNLPSGTAELPEQDRKPTPVREVTRRG
ncbi:hypothetical protein [Pseudarthrobacter sp. ATCC 49987]|nr:hypothetical protein [Pseudarthrobacter sp. ATCC 49987]